KQRSLFKPLAASWRRKRLFLRAAYTERMDVETPSRFEAVPVKTPAVGPLAVELGPAPDPRDLARRLAPLPRLPFPRSARRGGERGRYSYVAADPACWATDATRGIPNLPFEDAALMTNFIRFPSAEGLPPFQGGLAGLFGYGLNRVLEPRV